MPLTPGFQFTWLTDISTIVTGAVQVQGINAGREKDLSNPNGSFRVYANGRVRSITSGAQLKTRKMTLQKVAFADADVMESWNDGRVLLLRDGAGLLVYGGYMDLARTDIVTYRESTLSFTFTEMQYP